MTMIARLALPPSLLALLVLVVGCSDDGGNGGGCPSSMPAAGASCAESDVCSYPAESCPCGSDTVWECSCTAGKWVCHHTECTPCDGAIPDAGPDGPPGLDSCCLPDAEVDGEVLPDAFFDPCAACKSDEVCVQYFDGTCVTGGPTCVKVSAACLAGSCTPACEPELCPSPYQCQNQVPCGTEAGATVNCYGP